MYDEFCESNDYIYHVYYSRPLCAWQKWTITTIHCLEKLKSIKVHFMMVGSIVFTPNLLTTLYHGSLTYMVPCVEYLVKCFFKEQNQTKGIYWA
jgi:hypothetical protein